MGNMPVVEVGGRKVRVKRLLSEGGYARVYKVRPHSHGGEMIHRAISLLVYGPRFPIESEMHSGKSEAGDAVETRNGTFVEC